MKKLSIAAGAVAMMLVLSSCLFMMKSFSVGATSLAPGEKTTATFQLQPIAEEPLRDYQFVMVGTDDPADLAVGKATWGTNGKFTGPVPMTAEPGLPGVLTTAGYCDSAGLDLSDMTGITFRGYLTPTKISTKGKVDAKATVKVALRAKASAGSPESHTVVGVTGVWYDDDTNGTQGAPDLEDTFVCTGISTSFVYVG